MTLNDLRPRFRTIAVLACALAAAAGVQAQESGTDAAAWRASLGFVSVPGHSLYDGRLYLQTDGRVHGANYMERAHGTVGVRAGLELQARSAGTVALLLYGTRGNSTGHYAGIDAPASATRSLLVLGTDLGWQPTVMRAGAVTLAVPFGPALAWQRLRLSEGHRNAYAAPAAESTPDVEWSDRSWTSLGGHGGLTLNVRGSDHLGVLLSARGRFLFNRGSGSWGGSEQKDIERSTGNHVVITYSDLITLQTAFEVGLAWHP